MKLLSEEFETLYFPVETNEEGQYTFNTFQEALEAASKINPKYPLNHLWTAMDDDDGVQVIVNGNHIVNRFGHVVTEKPWGDYSEDNSSVYIEAEY